MRLSQRTKQRKFLWFKANLQILYETVFQLKPRAYESSSPNERKMPDALSPSRSTFYSGMERLGRNQLGLAGSYFFPKWGKMPDALSPYQIHILFGNGEAKKKPVRTKLLHEEPSTSLNLTLFTRRKTVIN